MSKTINFVQDRRKTLSLAEQQDQVILKKMIGVFVGIFLVFLVVLGGRLFLNYQHTQLLEDQKNARAGILQQESVEREFSIFAHKITHITALWGKRQNKQEAIAFFMQLFSGDTSISGISYSADSESLTFRLKTGSVFLLEETLNTLTDTPVTSKFPGISKSGLSRSSDASYSMNITVALSNMKATE
jgi:hypothetical protein